MSANDRQEGGDHYKQGSKPEHWDLVSLYGWDYFQGQITKYLMRWKYKHPSFETRLQDLKKARHFLDKYIEEASRFNPPEETPKHVIDEKLRHLGMSNDANSDEYFQCEGYLGNGSQHYRCRTCSVHVVAHNLSAALEEHGSCPGRGYVNQG